MARCTQFGYRCAALLILLLLASCSTYKAQVVPFKMPGAYPNVTSAGGAEIAARAYDDPNQAGQAFGFDIRGSGILPVEVIFDNRGPHSLEIVPGQTFLVDTANNLWPILDASLAYDRVEKKAAMSKVLPEAAKGSVLGGAAGAILGAAFGIVTGTNVGQAAGRGAAAGAAIGATVGGGMGLTDKEVQAQIREDLYKRNLESRPVKSGEIAYGFIFFPGEAPKAKELRLRIREKDTGEAYSLIMGF